MSGTKRSIIGSWGKRTAVMGASCREARAGVRRVGAFSSSLARDTNDLTCARSPKSRHGSLAAVHSASRAQPAHAHLGGAKKKAVGGAPRFLRFLRTRPPAFLRTIGALRLARTRDGRLHVAGLSPRGARHWEVLAAPRRSQRPPEEVVLWVVLDLDAARRRLKS